MEVVPHRVLVVDDEPQITRVLRAVLLSDGYLARTAAEGGGRVCQVVEKRSARDHPAC